MEFAVFEPSDEVKGLVILLGWTNSRPYHVNKYAQLWLEHGFRAAVVSKTPWPIQT